MPVTDRSLRLATDATIYRSRSRLRLWQGCHPTASSNGYTGSADLATVALAKRILGEAYRLDPTGLTMLLCSANDISAICSTLTKNITTRLAHTYRWTRTRQSRVPFRPSVERWRCQFWADCTTNISERNFRQGHQVRAHLNGIARIQSQDTSQMLLAKIRTDPSSPAGASQSGAQHVDSARADLDDIDRSRIPIARIRLVNAHP